VERLIGTHLLGAFAFGYVLHLRDYAPEHPLLVASDRHLDMRPEPSAFPALEPSFHGEAVAGAFGEVIEQVSRAAQKAGSS
jgi:hypothetical protein